MIVKMASRPKCARADIGFKEKSFIFTVKSGSYILLFFYTYIVY